MTVPHGDSTSSPSEHKQAWTALARWPDLAVKLGISLTPTYQTLQWSAKEAQGKGQQMLCPTAAPAALTDTSRKGHSCGEAEGQGGSYEGSQKKAWLSGSPDQTSWVPQRSPGTEVLSGYCLRGMGEA